MVTEVDFMKENELRDMIARSIEKLENGLVLLQKEKYIPNPQGTRGFIDLYAKDMEGKHVLIELKKSDAAAREAIHEVQKYVEGIKQYFGAKDDEIRVIIASIEWNELLVPYSRFVADASFKTDGLMLFITENNSDFTVEPVEPLPVSKGRFITPWHNVYWYSDKQSLETGIKSIELSYLEKGITDYVISVLYLKNQLTQEQRKEALREKVAQMIGVNKDEVSDFAEAKIPVHEYIAYVALQILSKEKCLQILEKDKERFAEALEYLPDTEEDEALCYLHEAVEALEPMPCREYYEIGYPAKFGTLTELDNCTVCGILRYGTFSRNTLLSDEVILSELRGEDGATGQKLKRQVHMQNHAHVAALKKDISTCLSQNPTWKHHISRIIEEIQIEFPHGTIEISIFNPCTGVFTIYHALTKENGMSFIPSYYIVVHDPDETRMYFGALQSNGGALTFPDILHTYYEGKLEVLLLTMTWGCADSRDNDIMEDLGATYCSFYCTIEESEQEFFALLDEKWKPCARIDPFSLFFDEYLSQNKKLVHQIIVKIQPHDMGNFFTMKSSIPALDALADIELGTRKSKYFHDAPDECDICYCSFANAKYMIDGKTKGGVWACMCADCFQAFGEGIAWRIGQLYFNNGTGWLLVGGSTEELDLKV